MANNLYTNLPVFPANPMLPSPNTIAANYSKLPKYNPGLEAVYNRMMSTPVAPNIGGEILKNLLGAYVGGNLGEAKQNYLEAVQGKEREDRLADEQKSWQNRLALENQQKEMEQQQLYKSLYDYMSSKPLIDEIGQPIGSNAIPPNIPAGTPSPVLLEMYRNAITPKERKPFELKDGNVLDPNTGTVTPIEGYKEYPSGVEEKPLGGDRWQKEFKGKPFGEIYTKPSGTGTDKQEKRDEKRAVTIGKQLSRFSMANKDPVIYSKAVQYQNSFKHIEDPLDAASKSWDKATAFVNNKNTYNGLSENQKKIYAKSLATAGWNQSEINEITGIQPNQKQPPTNEKTLDGVTYIQQDGKWHIK